MPATRCDVCGYADVIVRLRPLWLPIEDAASTRDVGLVMATSRGLGEYDLCAGCRNRVLDALHPPVKVRT